MSALVLLPIAAIVALVAAKGGKKGETGGGGTVSPPVPVPHVLTGTVGPVVYTLERAGDNYQWSLSTGEGSSDDSVKAAIRALFETALALPNVRPSDGVTGAAGPYTFAVSLLGANGDVVDWKWVGSDLGGDGAASAESDTSSSRGLGILAALSWLKKHGAVDWIAAPSKIDEPAAVGGGAPPPGGAKSAAGTVGAQAQEQEGPFPGLAIKADGTVKLVNAKAWQAYARPIITGVLKAGGPNSVGNLYRLVFDEVPGASTTFNGRSRKDTWAQVGAAIAKINGSATFVPDPAEWLADLIVAYYPKYAGVTQTYRGHVIVARPNPGAPAIAAYRWWAFDDGRELDERAAFEGVAASANEAVKIAKKRIDVALGKTPDPVKHRTKPKPRPTGRKSGSWTVPAVSYSARHSYTADVAVITPSPEWRRFKVLFGICLRTRSGATYGLMDWAVKGWPAKGYDKYNKPIPSMPSHFQGFQIQGLGAQGLAQDLTGFELPGVWKALYEVHVQSTGSAWAVVGTPKLLESTSPDVDPCPDLEARGVDKKLSIAGNDGGGAAGFIWRPWSPPSVEVVTLGKRIQAKVTYSGLPVFVDSGGFGVADLSAKPQRYQLGWRGWWVGEGS